MITLLDQAILEYSNLKRKGGSLAEKVALLKTFHRDLYPQVKEILGELPTQTAITSLRIQEPTPKYKRIWSAYGDSADLCAGYNNGFINLEIVFDNRTMRDISFGELAVQFLIMANYIDKIPKGFSLIRETTHESSYESPNKPRELMLWQTGVTYIMVKVSPDDSIFLR